jgi:(1->4)-alpha-D-glucan 1-alpha-D-glucosylmutase
MLNSLSQVFLKLVSPGIPDIYQGNESFNFCLVDPDNRRSVDYQTRQSILVPLLEKIHTDVEHHELNTLQHDLLANLPDGRAKMYIIAKILHLRNSWQEVFSKGSYLPLEVTGDKREHICAFAREKNEQMIVAVASRLFLTLMQGKKDLPLGDTVWHNTEVRLPENKANVQFQNIFSEHIVETGNGPPSLPVGRLLQSWPIALLKGVAEV